jgi:hypothetical protein
MTASQLFAAERASFPIDGGGNLDHGGGTIGRIEVST